MALPTNVLQTVQTYQDSNLGLLLNSFAFISTWNKKYQEFEKKEANLGDTVTFDLMPRFSTANSLIATFQSAAQRVVSLTVDQAVNTSYAFSAQQFIFNVRDYMDKFGKAATAEIGTNVESNVASSILDSTFRFFGDGVTPINSFGQLAKALAFFRNFGAITTDTRGYLFDLAVPDIVNSGLNQFVWDRNEELAMSWMLGKFSNCDWYQSNLLPKHTAGNVGQNATVLTVTSTNDFTGANITQITFSGAGTSDANAIKKNDLLYFVDGVSGQPNLRYLTFVGSKPSGNPVQFRATADATSDGSGNVTISIAPGLTSTGNIQTGNIGITNNIVAGMQVKSIPSHRRGLLMSGDAGFLAMPRLPEEIPYPTANKADPDSGASIRMYYGSLFGQNQRGFIHDVIWGKRLVPENAMALIFPDVT